MTVGRPSEYDPVKTPAKLKRYLDEYEPNYDSPRTRTDKNGNVEEWMETKPNPPLTMRLIAKHLGVCRDTLYQWAADHKEFSDIFKHRKGYAKDIVHENASLGLYNAGWSQFYGKASLGMQEKQVVESTNTNVNFDGADLSGLSEEDLKALEGIAQKLTKP